MRIKKELSMKRAQIWSLDVLVASVIFVLGLVFFYLYTLNYTRESGDALSFIRYDAERIADDLLTAGYPQNWSAGDVVMLGISDNNKVNEIKLVQLRNLADTNYERTRGLFATRYQWYLNFSESDDDENNSSIAYIGKKNDSPSNLFRVQRLTIYRNKPAVLNIHLWN